MNKIKDEMNEIETFNNKFEFKIYNIFHISEANSSSKREQVTKRLKFAHLVNRKLFILLYFCSVDELPDSFWTIKSLMTGPSQFVLIFLLSC